MIRPEKLKRKDTVAIVATGRRLDSEIVQAAKKIIEGWGLNVQLGNNLFSTNHSYLSGSDAERFSDLQHALNDREVKAIICARGGYGTTRVLDQLDFSALLKAPKWVCGFSDVTALQLRLINEGVQSIHSTMPVLFSLPEAQFSVECLRKILFGEATDLQAVIDRNNRYGENSAMVIGGNLSLIVDSLGTSSEIQTDGRILVIEEIDEYLYRVDRMMVQLKRAGKLHGLAGLVIGHLTDIKDTELSFGEDVHSLIFNHVKDYAYPVGFNFPIGHENPNLPWIQGGIGKLTVTGGGSSLSF